MILGVAIHLPSILRSFCETSLTWCSGICPCHFHLCGSLGRSDLKVWWPDSPQTRQIQNCGLDTFGIYESARYWITGSMQSTCICSKTSLAPPSSLCLQEAVAKKISSPQLHFSVTTRWLDSSGDAETPRLGLAWNWLWNQGWDLLDNSSEIDPKTCRNPHYKLGASWRIRYMASRRISRPINFWASRVGTNVDSIPESKSLKRIDW